MREPLFMCAVGQKGIGKSYQNIKTIEQVVAGNPVKGILPRRALVFDTNDEYTHIKAIAIDKLQLFSIHPRVEARRIRPFKPDGRPMTLNDLQEALSTVLLLYRQGLLLIEDLNMFASDNMKQDLIGALCTNRHRGLDIITSLQGIGRISPKMWQNLSWLRMHKISEAVAKHETKFEEKVVYLSIAEKIINTKFESGEKRFFLNIDLNYGKLYGRYTPSEFKEAAVQYMNENWRDLISPLLMQRQLGSGAKKYTEATAMQTVLNQLTTRHSQYAKK